MGSRRLLKHLIGTVFAILLFAAQPALADESVCKGLSTVKANDLLAMPELNLCSLPPSVSCTSQDPDGAVKECEHRAAITQDHMLGDAHRLIVVHSSIPGSGGQHSTASDQVYVFGCVGGQMKEVLDAGGCKSAAKIESATPDRIIITSYDSRNGNHPEKLDFRWDAIDHNYCPSDSPCEYSEHGDSFFDYSERSDNISCDQLKTIKADALTGIQTSGYKDAPSVDTDRMIGEHRFIIVRGCSADHCENGVCIFGCVSGRVKAVFDQELMVLKVDDLSPNKLVLTVASDFGKGGAYQFSKTNQITYVWNAEMQNYILSSMHLSPVKP